VARLEKPDATERPNFGTVTQREPGTGRIVTIYPDGRRVVAPEQPPVTTWPNDPTTQKPGK
jgi:hypothetical protein